MLRRAFVLSMTLATIAACGLAFEPGDYTWHVPDASAGEASTDTDATTGEGGGPTDGGGGGSHLLVFAGERDVPAGSGTGTETNDAWIADIDAKGDVTRWGYAQPTPYRGRIRAWTVENGNLYLARQANGNQRSLEYLPFANGPTGTWKGTTIEQETFYDMAGLFFRSNLLYAFGGGGTVQIDASAFTYQYTDTIRLRPWSPTDFAFDASVQSSTKLPAAMREMLIASYKDWVYVIGGQGQSTSQDSKARFAKIDPTPGVGVSAFTELPQLTNPATNQPYAVQQAAVCVHQSWLYILGGSSSDIVLGGKIDETTGAIASWTALTKLPGPLRDAGCAVYAGAMHLVGGAGATSRSEKIMRATIKPDGTLGEWELSSGVSMPGPRSSIAAIPY